MANDIKVSLKSDTKKATVGVKKAFKEIDKGAKKTEKGMKGLGSKLLDLAKGPIGVFFGAFAFGKIIGGFSDLIQSVIATGDELSKLSDKTGVSVEDLSELGFAAEQSGTDIDTLGKGLKELGNKISDASDGNKSAIKLFKDLGISIKDANGELKPTKDLFLEVADSIAKIEEPAKQAALAQDLMGRAGFELLPLLKESSTGIKELTDEAQKLGITFDKETAAAAVKAADAINKAKKAFEGLLRGAIAPLIGPLTKVAEFFAELFGTLGGDQVKQAVRSLREMGTEASKIALQQINIAETIEAQIKNIVDVEKSYEAIVETTGDVLKNIQDGRSVLEGFSIQTVDLTKEEETLFKTTAERIKKLAEGNKFIQAQVEISKISGILAKKIGDEAAKTVGFDSERELILAKLLNSFKEQGKASNIINLEQARSVTLSKKLFDEREALNEAIKGTTTALEDNIPPLEKMFQMEGFIITAFSSAAEERMALADKIKVNAIENLEELSEVSVLSFEDALERIQLLEEAEAAALERKIELVQLFADSFLSITNSIDQLQQKGRDKVAQKAKDQLAAEIEGGKLKLKLELKNEEISQKQFDDRLAALIKRESDETAAIEKEQNKRSKAFKVAMIAVAIIDTITSARQAFRSQLIPGVPFTLAAAFAAAAAALATGFAGVAAISATPFKHGGRLKEGQSGFIEGTGNEIIAPESDFISVVNELIQSRQISQKPIATQQAITKEDLTESFMEAFTTIDLIAEIDLDAETLSLKIRDGDNLRDQSEF